MILIRLMCCIIWYKILIPSTSTIIWFFHVFKISIWIWKWIYLEVKGFTLLGTVFKCFVLGVHLLLNYMRSVFHVVFFILCAILPAAHFSLCTDTRCQLKLKIYSKAINSMQQLEATDVLSRRRLFRRNSEL